MNEWEDQNRYFTIHKSTAEKLSKIKKQIEKEVQEKSGFKGEVSWDTVINHLLRKQK